MDPSSAKTDRRRRALAAAIAVILLGVGALRMLSPRGRRVALACLVVGAALMVLRIVRPTIAARLVSPLDRAIGLVGEIVGTVMLTLLYVLLVVPYALFLRAVGRLASPREAFPPSGSGWTPIGDGARIQVRAASSGWLGRIIGDLRSAALFLHFLSGRPSAVLIPIVVVVLLFAAAVLVGEVTGLGPLVYSIF